MRMSTAELNQLAVNAILEQQSAMSRTQNELSTGKRVNTPADNPVAAVQIQQLDNVNAQYTQYISNGQAANSRLSMEQQALSDATNALQSVRDLVVQANSGANNISDLGSIANQIQSLEQQLLGVANRQDGQGEYLFSGYSGQTQPFARTSSGAVGYLGDAGSRSVQLDAATSVQAGDPGSVVFMNIPTGNGTFTTAASSSNVGSGVIDPGTVTNALAWTPDQYTITFTNPTDYVVTNSTGTTVATGTYDASSGGSIAFEGIQVGLTGVPATGDTFTVSPSGQQSVFSTLDSLVSSLKGAGSSAAARAQLSSSLSGSLQQIDQALNRISNVTSQVGGRENLISSIKTSLTSQSTTVSEQVSNLANLDYVSATSKYSQEYTAMQAAEQSYAQIAQLSLFKYL